MRFKLLAVIVGGPTVDLGAQNHPAEMSASNENRQLELMAAPGALVGVAG